MFGILIYYWIFITYSSDIAISFTMTNKKTRTVTVFKFNRKRMKEITIRLISASTLFIFVPKSKNIKPKMRYNIQLEHYQLKGATDFPNILVLASRISNGTEKDHAKPKKKIEISSLYFLIVCIFARHNVYSMHWPLFTYKFLRV